MFGYRKSMIHCNTLWKGVAMATRENQGLSLSAVRKLPAAVDVSTAARALGISRSSAYAAISEGRFPVATITVGRRTKVLTHSLIAVLEGGRQAASA